MKIEIRTPTPGTLISLEVDFANIFYNIFNNNNNYLYRHIAILNCTHMIHKPSRPTTLGQIFCSNYVY